MIKCPKCGAAISDQDMFCSHCGYQLKPDREKEDETKETESEENKPTEPAVKSSDEKDDQNKEEMILTQSVTEIHPSNIQPKKQKKKKKRKKLRVIIICCIAAAAAVFAGLGCYASYLQKQEEQQEQQEQKERAAQMKKLNYCDQIIDYYNTVLRGGRAITKEADAINDNWSDLDSYTKSEKGMERSANMAKYYQKSQDLYQKLQDYPKDCQAQYEKMESLNKAYVNYYNQVYSFPNMTDYQLNEKVATKYADYETAMSEMSTSIDSLKNQLSN